MKPISIPCCGPQGPWLLFYRAVAASNNQVWKGLKFVRKSSLLFVVIIIALLFVAPVQAAEISLQGEIVQGRFLVPMRGIFEALGAEVSWDGDTRTVTGAKGDISVKLTIDSIEALVNNEVIELDVPATIIEGRTYVPTRFVSESLGADVSWDGEKRVATITQGVTIIKVHEAPVPDKPSTVPAPVPVFPEGPVIEGAFAVVEERNAYYIPGPRCPVTGVYTQRPQSRYWRAVITENEKLLLLDAPGKNEDDGESTIMSIQNFGDGLGAKIFYVMDLEFIMETVAGWMTGEREEIYLPEAQKTVSIIQSGEKVRITGNVTGEHYILKDLKKSSVFTIEKID